MEEADWEGEQFRRTINTPAHFGIDSFGNISRSIWERDIRSTIRELALEVVGSCISEARLDTLADWWSARWAWTPGGSSSARTSVNALKQSDDRLPSGARPNKKTIFEELPDDWASRLLAHYPPIYVARASTKHEPGGKSRALYAVNDENFIISAFASVHLEKHMNVWGIKAKQTPADVVDWIAAGRRIRPGQVWVSIDYSDYNTEHELSTLSRLNWELAIAWRKLGGSNAYVSQKVQAAVWAARAHQNAWVQRGSELWRVFGGLFSGDRDTARDNTALHGVYSRMALRYTQIVDPAARFISANYTGDDEDTLMNDWVSAMLYMLIHKLMEFVLKPEKQLVSAIIHEFLQRMAIPEDLPSRPLFAMLSQLASGNWYKDVYIWYDSAIASVSDNVWELVSRGMPVVFARRLAAEVINASMRVPDDRQPDGWRRLEWWSYRNNGIGPHPLWAGTGSVGSPCPHIEAKPAPGALAQGLATAGWITLKQRELGMTDSKGWKVYSDHCLKESYGGFYVFERSRAHRLYALNTWPIRKNHPVLLDIDGPPRPSVRRTLDFVTNTSTDRRPAKEEEVLSRMGLDQALVSSLGGLTAVLRQMKPDVMKYYSRPELTGYVPLELFWLDPAIRAWYGATAMSKVDSVANYQTRLARHWPPSTYTTHHVDDTIKYFILAPNAAGKSSFTNANPWCADTDRMVSSLQLHQDLHFNSKSVLPRSTKLLNAVHDILHTQGYTAMTTQMDVDDLIAPPLQRPYSIKIIIVLPPAHILQQRMQLRGWDALKIERRISRWMGIVSRLPTARNLSTSEKDSITTYDSFSELPSL
jgi:hypothetical protein